MRLARDRALGGRDSTKSSAQATGIRPQGRGRAVALLAILASLGISTSAASASTSLNLPGSFAKADFCPIANPETRKCLNTQTQSGWVTLGKKTVPIVNPVTFQGGYGKTVAEEMIGPTFYERIQPFTGVTGGLALSHTPQPVPGGLLGLVPPASSPPSVRALTASYSENGASGVTATVELAGGEIFVSEFNLLNETNIALRLPIKVHIENPFFGSSCYIGSNSSPIIWNATTGQTSPPAPNKPIGGVEGELNIEAGSQITQLPNAQLVDNAWAAPGVTGCGGALAPILDPLIDSAIGLPSPAGRNTLLLHNVDVWTSSSAAVEHHLP
jgi:hypothetical protein